jgi:hypothetical protein
MQWKAKIISWQFSIFLLFVRAFFDELLQKLNRNLQFEKDSISAISAIVAQKRKLVGEETARLIFFSLSNCTAINKKYRFQLKTFFSRQRLRIVMKVKRDSFIYCPEAKHKHYKLQ